MPSLLKQRQPPELLPILQRVVTNYPLISARIMAVLRRDRDDRVAAPTPEYLQELIPLLRGLASYEVGQTVSSVET